MVIGVHHFSQLRFPGRAGALQDQGSTASLISELGDRYDEYHDFLAEALQRFGGRPDPDDFTSVDEFFAAYGYLQEVVVAEMLLRNARAFRANGRRLDAKFDSSTPVVDQDDRLVRQPEASSADTLTG